MNTLADQAFGSRCFGKSHQHTAGAFFSVLFSSPHPDPLHYPGLSSSIDSSLALICDTVENIFALGYSMRNGM